MKITKNTNRIRIKDPKRTRKFYKHPNGGWLELGVHMAPISDKFMQRLLNWYDNKGIQIYDDSEDEEDV